MNVETVREYCLNKKGVTESFPFDDVSLVVKVMNKMFALIDLEEANHIALKCDPEKAIELREHYSGIEGAYHFNKKYWNSVRFDSDVDDKLMKELIDHSYDEVIKKFTKKLRAEYDALNKGYTVYIKSVAFAYFNRAETKIFCFTMQNLTGLIQ